MRNLATAILGAVIAAQLLLGSAHAQTPPNLEAFLSYRFDDELSSPDQGGAIAWTELHQGTRNVWMAQAPDFKPHRLTNGTADDGQELTGLTWSPDGKTIAWVRGGDHDHNPWANGLPPPNPASALEQPQMEIWTSIAGAPARKITEGDAPAVAVTGQIAFLRNGQVWSIDAAGQGKPANLFYDWGKDDSLVWSPDGTKLAFVSRRGDHNLVGVYAGPDHPIRWLAPSTAYDDNPVWSPDGRRIGFSRRPGNPEILQSQLVERPQPFSLWVASVADDSAHPVWTGPNTPNGSYPQVPGGLFLMWAADDRLTFRAELDGWAHLYAVAVVGGAPRLLTPGGFIVEHVTMTPDRRGLLYSANAGALPGDIDRRHVFRVPIDGSKPPAALSAGTGLEWTPVPVGLDKVAYVSSTPTQPTRVAIMTADGGGAHSLTAEDASYPTRLMTIPKPVTFTAADGLLVHGQLFVPTGSPAKKPGLIFVHGGPPRQMLLGWSYMDYYTHAYAMNQYLASQGFVVLSVNYRLGIGYGRAFQHPEKAGLAGNSEYQDVVAGARFLQTVPGVDPDRIGIWGGSYGGLLTAQALARNSDLFKAGVDFHGISDFSYYTNRVTQPKRYEQGDYAQTMKSAFESSPEGAIAGWRSPVLLIQGDDDHNVPFSQTVDLARRLAAQGTPYETLILPNEIHGFLRYDSWIKADTASLHFFQNRLRP